MRNNIPLVFLSRMLLTEFGKIEQENVIVNKVCILKTTCQSIAVSAGAGCMEVVVSPPHSKQKISIRHC